MSRKKHKKPRLVTSDDVCDVLFWDEDLNRNPYLYAAIMNLILKIRPLLPRNANKYIMEDVEKALDGVLRDTSRGNDYEGGIEYARKLGFEEKAREVCESYIQYCKKEGEYDEAAEFAERYGFFGVGIKVYADRIAQIQKEIGGLAAKLSSGNDKSSLKQARRFYHSLIEKAEQIKKENEEQDRKQTNKKQKHK